MVEASNVARRAARPIPLLPEVELTIIAPFFDVAVAALALNRCGAQTPFAMRTHFEQTAAVRTFALLHS
jgi:hypothetical protein